VTRRPQIEYALYFVAVRIVSDQLGLPVRFCGERRVASHRAEPARLRKPKAGRWIGV